MGIYGTWISLDFEYDPHGFFFQKNLEEIDPKQIDVILIRLPQPVDIPFLLSLEKIISPQRIINNPEGIIKTSSKAFLLEVEHLCPPVQMCESLAEAIALSQQYEIVLKPLYSFGGRGLMRLSKDWCWNGNERHPIDEVHDVFSENQFPMLAMRFLKNVTHGDKRTIVCNKKILGSAIRFPAEGQWICNVAQGGHPEISVPDENELRIEAALTPLLFEKGIVIYGFDTLVDDDGRRTLSEINTMSIGGLMPMQELSGRPLVEEAAKGIWDFVSAAALKSPKGDFL